MITSAKTRLRKRTGYEQRKDDHERVLKKLLRADARYNIDIMIRPTCMSYDTNSLIVELKFTFIR